MADKAGINRSLNNVRTELEYLRDSGVLHPQQFQSITAQLPQPGGVPSEYVDPRYAQGANNVDPGAIAKASQDPNHPAHPNHPKVGALFYFVFCVFGFWFFFSFLFFSGFF